jgi:hypothetical protein
MLWLAYMRGSTPYLLSVWSWQTVDVREKAGPDAG